jgi:hypothetical protein
MRRARLAGRRAGPLGASGGSGTGGGGGVATALWPATLLVPLLLVLDGVSPPLLPAAAVGLPMPVIVEASLLLLLLSSLLDQVVPRDGTCSGFQPGGHGKRAHMNGHALRASPLPHQ